MTRGRCTDVNGRKNREKMKEHKLCQERVHSDKLGGKWAQKGVQNTRNVANGNKGRTLSTTKGVSAVPRNS